MIRMQKPKDGRWRIILDGDDTLWLCRQYFDRAAEACYWFLKGKYSAWPHDLTTAFIITRKIQRGMIRRWGYSQTIFEEAWAGYYLQTAHNQGWKVSPVISLHLIQLAGVVKTAPYTLFDGVTEALDRLQTNHELHLLTLGDMTHQRLKVQRNKLDRFFNDQAGTLHIIQRSKGLKMRLLAMDGRPTVMVGDSPRSDIQPAVKLGLPAVWVHNDDPWVHEDCRIDLSIVPRIGHLAELPQLLKQISPSTS